MKDYVQYHNTELMGYPCDEGDGVYFSIVTNKPILSLPGNRIWLISGVGKPRKYALCEVFTVDRVKEDGSENHAMGSVGTAFRPPIPLNNRLWFKEFLKSQQNFRFGLNEIREKQFVGELERLTLVTSADVSQELERTSIEELSRVGAGFGDPETNRKTERAAIAFVTRWYESRGWKVKSVEAEKCGYDLLCAKASLEEHVEVKGVRGELVAFIITAAEVRQAHVNSKFVICVVTSALAKPKLLRYVGREFGNQFDLAPLAFRAILRE
jgi:Domain of unknown function (DUF3883)